MVHPDTELKFINEEIGHGVFAKRLIKKGTLTWVQDKLDREYSIQQIQQMDEIYQELLMTYTFRNNKGLHIFCWDHGRYINHSFKPNCMTTPYRFEIAIRDIKAGEQLTNDYGYLNIIEPFEPFPEKTRRKIVYPDDLIRYFKVWDKLLASAFQKIDQVDQPLFELLGVQMKDKIKNILNGKDQMDSILNCYFSATPQLPECDLNTKRQD